MINHILIRMHLDKEDFNVFMFAKFGIVLLIFQALPLLYAMITLILLAITYQHVIAAIFGLHVMPSMDLSCFYSNDKAVVNIISITPLTRGEPAYSREAFGRIMDAHLKARTGIVKVCGDMYYKELPREEVLKQVITVLPDGHLKTKEDVEKFVAEILP